MRTVLAAVAAGALIGFWSAGCEDPLAPFNEISATSGAALHDPSVVVAPHTHRATIAARDVNDPPANDVILTTTSGGSPTHTHSVRLSPAQLTDLQQNMAIVNVTSSVDEEHRHNFLFER